MAAISSVEPGRDERRDDARRHVHVMLSKAMSGGSGPSRRGQANDGYNWIVMSDIGNFPSRIADFSVALALTLTNLGGDRQGWSCVFAA